MTKVPVLLLTGPIGVGKSTVADEVALQLLAAGRAYALIEIDWLSVCNPRPSEDRWNDRLAWKNLGDIWPNYVAAGADRLILPYTVENPSDYAPLAEAVPGAALTVVRLRAKVETLLARVTYRELGSLREPFLERSRWHARIMEERRIGDLVVDTDEREVGDIAAEVLRRVGWLT